MSSSGSYDGSEGSGYGEWYGGSHYPPDPNRARSYGQGLEPAYGASPRGRFLYIHREWWETDDRPRRRSSRPSPDQGLRRPDRDRRTYTGPEHGREDNGDRDPSPRRPPSRGPSSRGPPSPDNLGSGRRRPRRPNPPAPGPAPPSLYSERDRRPYGNLLEAPPPDPPPEGERPRRSDDYDDPAPRSSHPPTRTRSSLARRGSVSPPRSRSRNGNLRGDGYEVESGPAPQRGSGRRRSSGFRRGSRPSLPPRSRSREDIRVYGYEDGPEPSPARENCRRRSFGLGRRSTEPLRSSYQGRRPSLSERFESHFISPVRRRLDRFTHGPTDHDRLWRSYPPSGDNRRESMYRRDRPRTERGDSDRLPGLDDRFVDDNGSPTGSHQRARMSDIEERGVEEVGSVRTKRQARLSSVEESELGYGEMHGALQ